MSRKRFSDPQIDEVRVERDRSADGHGIVNVVIVFGKPPKTISLGSLNRTPWKELSTRDDEMLPIFYFLTREENERLSAAA
tara:strand:+ start:1152 stop:1394 length:243 start_codon:yes stop_codon:yes gene_type:complete